MHQRVQAIVDCESNIGSSGYRNQRKAEEKSNVIKLAYNQIKQPT